MVESVTLVKPMILLVVKVFRQNFVINKTRGVIETCRDSEPGYNEKGLEDQGIP